MRTRNLMPGILAVVLFAPAIAQADILMPRPLTYAEKKMVANGLNKLVRQNLITANLVTKAQAKSYKPYSAKQIAGQGIPHAGWNNGPFSTVSISATAPTTTILLPTAPNPSGCLNFYPLGPYQVGASIEKIGDKRSRLTSCYIIPPASPATPAAPAAQATP